MGVDPSSWTIRELFQAVEAKQRALWVDWSYALHWIVNAIPNMSATPRPTITPEQINPFLANEVSGDRIALTTSNPAARAALDAWAARSESRASDGR